MTQDTGRDHDSKNPALLHCMATSLFQTVPSHTISGVSFHFCLMKLLLFKTAVCLLTEFFPLRRQEPRKSPFCRWHLLVRITESSEAFFRRAHSALWFYHFTSLCCTGILGNDSSKSKRLIYKPTYQFIHLYQGN